MEEDEDHIFTSNADLQAGDSIGDCSMEGKYSSNESDECQGFMCQDSLSDVEIDTPKVASDVVIDTPKVGMEFDTYDAIVDYYARYAKQEGFAVYKRSSKKGKDGKLRYVTIECHRAGKPSNKGSTLLNPRPQSKLNCPARIRASLSPNDKFTLTFVCLDHNHERSPGKVKYFSSNRRIDENALSRNVEAESEADANSLKSFIPCISKHDELERQFQSVYTNNKVREFQKEIRRRLECQVWTRSEDAYVIKEKIHFGEGESMYQKLVFFEVSFNEETLETQCSCRLFEFRGMVCAHQLTVWNDLGVENVPDKYVFKRWCKNVKRAHTLKFGLVMTSLQKELKHNSMMTCTKPLKMLLNRYKTLKRSMIR